LVVGFPPAICSDDVIALMSFSLTAQTSTRFGISEPRLR
jgi:hypothetical protein